SGEIEKATTHLDALRRLNALTARLRYLKARSHYSRGEYKDALELMQEVTTEEPDNAEYMLFTGQVYFARKAYDTAQRYFEDALSLDSTYIDARFYIGRTELERGNIDEALKVLRGVHDERPTNGEYHYYLGYALETANRNTEAMKEYKRLLNRAGDEEDPSSMFGVTSPLVHFRRGRLFRAQGKRKNAQE